MTRLVIAVFALGLLFSTTLQAQYFTDTGSPANPAWSTILPTLNVASADPGPVPGSVINVNNTLTEVGLYGNRPISVGTQRIHIPCNTSSTNLTNFTRWFQTDGNTQVFRMFVNDENTATTRDGSTRSEAFTENNWSTTNNTTFEWTGRYTIAARQQGAAIFQVKNTDNDWAVQLNITSSGALIVNNRRNASDVTLTNPDGSTKDFDGQGFDVRIHDDGLNYKVWIDGVLYADNFYSRPTGGTQFRWGMYLGSSILTSPSTTSTILVSGAQVKSWSGDLNTAITAIVKANNNAANLSANGSWVGNVAPGLYEQAVWNNTVNATNCDTTLNAEQVWSGIKITNPATQVTINGTSTLGLDQSGVDMSTATRNLVVNCPVELRVTAPWNIASSVSATFSNTLKGYGGITVGGNGTVILSGTNTYSGPTTINGGTLRMGNGGTTGSLSIDSIITVESGATFQTNRSDNIEQGSDFSSTPISGAGGFRKSGTGKLTLTAANTFTGPTSIDAGTLAFDIAMPFGNTTGITMANATLLQPLIGGVLLNKPITLGGAGTTAALSAPTNLPGGGNVSAFTLGGIISGTGNVTFTSSANQNALSTVVLNAANTYTGNTLLDTDGTSATQVILRLGTSNALPTSTVLTIDGQLGAGSGRFAEVNLNGFSQELAGLTNIARSLRVQRIVNSNVSNSATLTINNNNDYNFSGSLGTNTASGSVTASAMPGSSNGNNFALTKKGTGTFILSGINTYSGHTTVSAGTLELNRASAGNALASTTNTVASGATLRLAGTASGLSANAHVTNSGTISVTGTAQSVGNISGAGSTTVSGAGTTAVPTLIARDIDQASLTINNGAYVRIAASSASTSVVTTLTLGTTTNLDITNNDIIVNNPTPVAATSSLAVVAARVNAGFVSGGNGIVTTTTGLGIETVGFGLNSFLSYSTFNGVTVNDDSVLIKFTYFGDSNLDGFVTDDDLGYFLAGYGNDITGNPWVLGDYNHDGFTTDDDLGYFLAAYGSTPGLASDIQAIPEPSSMVLGTFVALGLGVVSLRRRPMQ